MSLIPHASTKGLWVVPGDPATGAHALIVGISAYPYLSGGSATNKAPNSGGLGQLAISALTAVRIFDWLRSAEAVAGGRIASCRLLLSPVGTELAEIDGLTQGNYATADFAAWRSAIEAWRDSIFAGRTGTDPNTALFFFSGHGVEHLASPALLAADILDPNAAGSESRAIAIEAVARAIKTSGIDRALFFVDACRNAPAIAMTLNIVGQEIIKPVAYPPKSPDAVISLQSTRSGLQAFQVPGDTATIFGKALLEALDGPPPTYMPYDTKSAPWRLVFSNLESHVKNRVRDLLAVHTSVKIQPVEPSGIPYDGQMIVAEKSPGLPPSAPTVPSPDLGALVAQRSDKLLREFQNFGLGKTVSGTILTGGLHNFDTMHEILGHESVTNPFIHSLSILDARTGERLPQDSLSLAQGRSSEVGDSLTAWLDVEIPPGTGRAVWIGLDGKGTGPSFAVVIPRDLDSRIPVRLDVQFKSLGNRAVVESLSARLAEPKDGDYYGEVCWRPLWELQRIEAFSDLGAAGLKARDLDALRQALYEKATSPVGAAIAAQTLIRSGNLDILYDWPRNLATRFPWLPDGGILWAETILRRLDSPKKPDMYGADADEARRSFIKSLDEGLPLLSATLKMAIGQARIFGEPPRLNDLDSLPAVDLLRHSTKFFVSGGLFASFVAPQSTLLPRDIFPAPRVPA
jgi:hypothetical protein